MTNERKILLNVGSGKGSLYSKTASVYPATMELFPAESWEEVRVDANPDVDPDVVADARDLPYKSGSIGAIVCFACLEHMSERGAVLALTEFHRVLGDDGYLVIEVPNLEAAARLIIDGRFHEVLHEPSAGPVRAIDMIYGHQQWVDDYPLMSHHTGFTRASLSTWLNAAGFDGSIHTYGVPVGLDDPMGIGLIAHVQKTEENHCEGFHFYQRRVSGDGNGDGPAVGSTAGSRARD